MASSHPSKREHYDALETRSADERDAQVARDLPRQIAHAVARAPAIAARLGGIDPQAVTSRAALAALPVLRKSDLLAGQNVAGARDAFGGFATVGWGASRPPAERAVRVFFSPGPIREPETARPDYWRMARALFAAGLRAGDLVHNSFSYHLTPAGSMMESGAHALGCTVFPGGTGQTEQQLQAMTVLAPSAYTGTPSFLRLLLEKADESGDRVAVARQGFAERRGGAGSARRVARPARHRRVPELRHRRPRPRRLRDEAREGLVIDEGVVVEIVAPATNDPVADGEIGELVVTTLNPDYPLVRYATGDLSAILPGTCPTGRTNRRIRGWLGRADQSTKVRGMFVHPSQIGEISSAAIRRSCALGSSSTARWPTTA
jgi:phenylacetate-CoA ligase